jgi:hypothetical protein
MRTSHIAPTRTNKEHSRPLSWILWCNREVNPFRATNLQGRTGSFLAYKSYHKYRGGLTSREGAAVYEMKEEESLIHMRTVEGAKGAMPCEELASHHIARVITLYVISIPLPHNTKSSPKHSHLLRRTGASASNALLNIEE